jgi:sugar-specific transcriptional regulator TrmB
LSLKDEDAVVLTQIGLTNSQAKVYLTLLELGQATGKIISKKSKIARQEIYRILRELQEKGCVVKLIALPTQFMPVPIEECLSALIRQKKQEILEAENRAIRLIDAFKNKLNSIPDKETFMMLVPEREAYLRKFRNSIINSTISCDMILHWECLLYGLTVDHDLWQQATSRGVKIRFLVHNVPKEQDNNSIIERFMINGHFEIKFALYPLLATITLWDGKEASISLSPKPYPHNTTNLWTNNPGLFAVFQDYFKTIWRDSCKETDVSLARTSPRKHANKIALQ